MAVPNLFGYVDAVVSFQRYVHNFFLRWMFADCPSKYFCIILQLG